LIGIVVALALTAGTARAQQTINPSGGTTASNGLRIVIQPNTAFQIYRNNAQQLYITSGDGPDIAVGTAVTGTYITGAAAWTNVSQSAVTGSGTSASPWQVTTTVRTASNVVVAMTIRYVNLDDTIDLRVVITPPGSNTAFREVLALLRQLPVGRRQRRGVLAAQQHHQPAPDHPDRAGA
jgi:hypothetical protein